VKASSEYRELASLCCNILREEAVSAYSIQAPQRRGNACFISGLLRRRKCLRLARGYLWQRVPSSGEHAASTMECIRVGMRVLLYIIEGLCREMRAWPFRVASELTGESSLPV